MELTGTALEHGEAVAASLGHAVRCMSTGAVPPERQHQSAESHGADLRHLRFRPAQPAINLPMEADPELTLDRIFAST